MTFLLLMVTDTSQEYYYFQNQIDLYMKKLFTTIVICSFAFGAWLIACKKKENNPVSQNTLAVDPTTKVYEKSMAEWSALWWIWATQNSCSNSPLKDPTGT